ncbi:MAG: DNA topoisomerase 3 [Desulfobacterales bacterium]|nr:DNA topoisomerase 3 [Desulfobacterales bacterium]MBF0395262.1 DNA topoisomerase 3 [Desulfobacterales bacterium]
MGKTLILTEKPSVAMDFAKALQIKNKKDGYIEDSEYIITWAVGHLVTLFEPEDYDPKWSKWRLNNLPIIPDQFKYKPISKTKKQFNIINSILSKESIDKIIIATDAGREGEVIARTILMYNDYYDENKTLRFWTSQALTPKVVKEGLDSVKSAKEYDRLWHAGQARQIADWLVGMNGSRVATITMNDLFTVGRVQTAVLALIVNRRRERENFKPEIYWLISVKFSNEKGIWIGRHFKEDEGSRFNVKEKAQEVVDRVKDKVGVVISVKKEKKKQPPFPLYSLTDLQRDANIKLGLSAKNTLDIAQSLYEDKKCLSYPRTDSKVLGSKNIDMVKKIVEKLSESYKEIFGGINNELISGSNKRVFNDAKLTDHHALIPLSHLPSTAKKDESNVYNLVLKRFAASFYPDCEYEQTEIITDVEKELFKTTGRRILNPGWQAVYGKELEKEDLDEEEQSDLPALISGDSAKVEKVNLEEKKTSPPPEYTEALLLKDMTNPAKYVSEEELKKIYKGDVGLGTQATRAQIIETLLLRKYVERKKKQLLATDKGCELIDTLRKFETAKILTSPEETARWEIHLEQIAYGEGSDEKFISDIKKFIEKTVEEFKNINLKDPARRVEINCKCPKCGGEIIEGKKGFGCSNWKKGCKFVVWKTIAGKTLSVQEVETIIQKGITDFLDGFISKKGSSFSARLKLEIEGLDEPKVVFDFKK